MKEVPDGMHKEKVMTFFIENTSAEGAEEHSVTRHDHAMRKDEPACAARNTADADRMARQWAV